MTSLEGILGRSVNELRKLFIEREHPAPAGLIDKLESDRRSGARKLAGQIRKRRIENRDEAQRLGKLLRYETQLWNKGLNLIAGVDEAGIGPLAGPVVASAVILPKDYRLAGLNDSKKISAETKREKLAAQIKLDAVCWSVGQAEVEEIDRINIYHAGLLAMQRAVHGLAVEPEFIMVDARKIPNCAIPQRGIVHGDALCASIAAASIIAKTTRDALMAGFDRLYQGYNFASHKGYPTPEHCRLLKQLGALPIHRRSFERVREALRINPPQPCLFDS